MQTSNSKVCYLISATEQIRLAERRFTILILAALQVSHLFVVAHHVVLVTYLVKLVFVKSRLA